MDNMTSEEQGNHNFVMKELGDIKTSLAVNTNETSNTKIGVTKIEVAVTEIVKQVKETNGRVTRLEDWSNEARKVIENTTKIANETYGSYKTDKTRIWAAVGILLFLGSTIITLSIMAINSKIKDGINEALSQYQIEQK